MILTVETIKQAKMKEKNKSVSQKNKKSSRNQIIQRKSHQRNKHPITYTCKIPLTIIKID